MAFKAARYMALYGASLNSITRILERDHKQSGLSKLEIYNHLKKMKLWVI